MGDRGSVTVEAAVAMTAIIAVLVPAIGGLLAVADHIRCVDAAREAARLAARGEPDRAHTIATRLAPDGADIRVTHTGDDIEVTVEASQPLLAGLRVRADAVAAAEEGVAHGQ